VQEQNINFHTILHANNAYRKSSRLDPPKIAEDLYNKAFKHAPKLGWATLGIILLIIVCLLILYFFNKPFWTDFGWMIPIGIVVIIYVIDKNIFSFLFNQVEKTDFYNLSRITKRKEVKRLLQERDWGDNISNWISYFVIGFWLEPDKNRANRRKI
jgi:hypothetical protein